MKKEVLFRADKRAFAVGETIYPAGEFLSKNPSQQRDVEEVFEGQRPASLPSRLRSLYLFEDQEHAMKYWCRMSQGKLYEVELSDGISMYRGDMRLSEEAYRAREDRNAMVVLAKRYWSGGVSSHPVIEVLVDCAVVTRILSKDESERLAYFHHYGLGKPRPDFPWSKG